MTRLREHLPCLIGALVLGLMGPGCWKMQDLGAGSGADTGDTDTGDDTDSDTDTWTDPWPIDIEMCDIDILFVFDTSQSMMLTVDALAQEGFAGFTNMLSSYPEPGTINVAMTNHLYGGHYLNSTTVNCSEFLTRGMGSVQVDTSACMDVPAHDCNFASGQVWMEGPSDTLPSEFNCVGRLPCQEDTSHEEETIQAGLEALEDPFNAGFVRDEALLFLVFVSDEDDDSEMWYPTIRQGLLALKDGDEDYVYVATMAGAQDQACQSPFFGEADATPGFYEFVELFGDHGRHFNMCSTSMSSALAAMVDLLTQACQEVL